MIGRDRMAGAVLLGLALGISTLAFSQQQPADSQQPTPQQDAPTPPAPTPDPELANQVQQLQAEVDQLKAQLAQLNSVVEQLQNERAATPPPAPPNEKLVAKKGTKSTAVSGKKMAANPAPPVAAAVPEETAPTAVLVFHDGHRTEARNYAIVGQTLWIYTQDESQKVPLSDLDVAATKNANSDRGIIFQMPAAR